MAALTRFFYPSIGAAMSPMHRRALYFVFVLSGFSGLVYESIWSHYLKLYLGHSAYAQSLVLIIFMGGMALGANIASRCSTRIRDVLLTYAVVEALIGGLGLLFHPLFVGMTSWSYDTVLPALHSPALVQLFRWSMAALLMLPASVLMGATFPLMTASVLRQGGDNAGRLIATLYFCNSIGASVGAVLSGFVLIGLVGLPGTVLTAAVINLLVAVSAYSIAGEIGTGTLPVPANAGERPVGTTRQLMILLLLCSGITGLSSFMYEVGWIRMLSLVLGASSHSFELMLSAFILGIALGGLWIRKHIDSSRNPMGLLACVQLFMGLLALLSLFSYGATFGVMSHIMHVLRPSEEGYLWFNISSHLICVFVMIPVTFFAGMTLPLITAVLLRHGHGEKAVGAVYAVNTVGAILGTVIAVWLAMPLLGLKGTIVAGALLDIFLALLLWHSQRNFRAVGVASVLALLMLLITLPGFKLDARKMASGVYRTGSVLDITPIFHQDGRTASIDVFSQKDNSVVISTNGKPDASIGTNGSITPDEPTMTLAGVLPLMMHHAPANVAVIGMGSGMTGAAMLQDSRIKSLDMIEIEPAIIEGARVLSHRADPLFTDPRAHIHIDDAKSFFAMQQSRYDVIVSEPSNPWVSGVSGLFSDQFYDRIQHHLAPGGYLVQWLHIYESNSGLVRSIVGALQKTFPRYEVWASNSGDIIIIAGRDKTSGFVVSLADASPALIEALRKVGIVDQAALHLHRLGSSAVLGPYLTDANIPINSDYFPYVDLHAVKARFLKEDMVSLAYVPTDAQPFLDIIEHAPVRQGVTAYAGTPVAFTAGNWAKRAVAYRQKFLEPDAAVDIRYFSPDDLRRVFVVAHPGAQCSDESLTWIWLPEFVDYSRKVLPYLDADDIDPVLDRLERDTCLIAHGRVYLDWIKLVRAISHRDTQTITEVGRRIQGDKNATGTLEQLLTEAMLAAQLADGRSDEVAGLFANYGGPNSVALDVMTRLLQQRMLVGVAGTDVSAR
jgi:predicted membrane-bound spermidine synthase